MRGPAAGAVRWMPAREAELAVSVFGVPTDPAVLLIAGAGSSMDHWEPEFCASLAAAGRYVVRYDHRDTGESTACPPGEPGYTGDDLIEDAAAVLTGLGLARAHLVGISMGGGIAQVLTLRRPDLVTTLTLIATSGGAGDDDLPPMGGPPPPPAPDWSDRRSVVEYQVEAQRAYAGEPFDEAAARAVAERAFDRTTSPESADRNHHLAPGGSGSWRSRLPSIRIPALVLHGDADPLFPLGHGEALAGELGRGRLVVLPGAGHELPRRCWPVVLRELIAHTS